MTKFTYIPGDGDPHDTEIMRVLFVAGEPADIDETSEFGMQLAAKLRTNPWFHEGDNPPAVKARWADRAAALRKQARDMWISAHELDPAGTDADVTPPQYLITLKERKEVKA